MSLLIKALDKAEKAQAEQQKLEKTDAVAPRNSARRRAGNLADPVKEAEAPVVLTLTEPEQAQVDATQALARPPHHETHSAERASNVFASKAAPAPEIKPILWVVLFGVLALLSIGGYFYYQLNQLQAPKLPPASRPSGDTLTQVPAAPAVVTEVQVASTPTAVVAPSLPPLGVPALTASEKAVELAAQTTPPKASASEAVSETSEPLTPPEPELQIKKPNAVYAERAASKEITNVVSHVHASSSAATPSIASESASIKVSRNTAAPAVNPVLLSAYNSYLAGNDSEAQPLYRRVLQRDPNNIDALLGMAAIAERQQRTADALGWYQKVLESDPKNSIALAATLGNIQDQQTQLSQLKTLVAQHPNDANAHANLGAYFAEQGLWPEAQQAYFEAFRLNGTADNAFNLAVSLDQMGKSSLALTYYQQALALMPASTSSSIDISALQSRMAAIKKQ